MTINLWKVTSYKLSSFSGLYPRRMFVRKTLIGTMERKSVLTVVHGFWGTVRGVSSPTGSCVVPLLS